MRRLGDQSKGLLDEADDAKDLSVFLLDLLDRLKERQAHLKEIVVFIDQLERTFESGEHPELSRLNKISKEVVKLLQGVGIDKGIRVLLASRKQYLPDFLSSSQKANDIHLHFNVLQTLSVDSERVEFVKQMIRWCSSKRLTLEDLEIDDDAARDLALKVDGHPLNMMLALIRLLSMALPQRISRATLESTGFRPWEHKFHVDEALAGRDEIDWYFFLAMAHARTEIVRFEEVWWRLRLVEPGITRRASELGRQAALERLWLLGHLGRTIHPRPLGEDKAGFLEFFHANLRDHLLTNVMNRGGDDPSRHGPRPGMPVAWRALDRLREIAKNWEQNQQLLLKDDIDVLMQHKDVFTEPISTVLDGKKTEVEAFVLLFMRDADEERQSLLWAAKECIAYSALVHEIQGRWAFRKLFPEVSTEPRVGVEDRSQVGCCRRWLRRCDPHSRIRILHYLVELRDPQGNRQLADLVFDRGQEDEPWRQLASVLAEPLIASTYRSAFLTSCIGMLVDRGIAFPGDDWHATRFGAFVSITCAGDRHQVGALLNRLFEEAMGLGNAQIAAALKEVLNDARWLESWVGTLDAAFDPELSSRALHDAAPPELELRWADGLRSELGPEAVERWHQQIEERLGVPIPRIVAVDSEVSVHDGEDAAGIEQGHELELLIRGRLVALGRFFPGRVQTLRRDWGDVAARGTIPEFNEALLEPVRWVEASELEGKWHHKRWTFDEAVIDWLHTLLSRYITSFFDYDDVIPCLERLASMGPRSRVTHGELRTLASDLRIVWTIIVTLVRERVPLGTCGGEILVRLVELVRESEKFELELVNQKLREHVSDDLCKAFCDDSNQLVVLLLDPDDELWLADEILERDKGRLSLRKLGPDDELGFVTGLRERFEVVSRADHTLPVLVCEDHLRLPLFELLRRHDGRIHVLSYTELSPEVRLTSRGVIPRFFRARNGVA